MTIDERIERLVEADERLREDQAKTQEMLAGVVDSIKRLERIAGVLLLNDEDLDRRLSELENRQRRKPQ